jgi:hypothetical protein
MHIEPPYEMFRNHFQAENIVKGFCIVLHTNLAVGDREALPSLQIPSYTTILIAIFTNRRQ